VAARGGHEHIAGFIFHTDRGTYTAEKFTALCRRLGIRQGATGPRWRTRCPWRN
jgi:hypothetical protein